MRLDRGGTRRTRRTRGGAARSHGPADCGRNDARRRLDTQPI